MEKMDKLKSIWRGIGLKLDILYTKKWCKGIRYGVDFLILCAIFISPLQMVGQATDQTIIQKLLPQPKDKVGLDVYHAIYRDVVEKYLPIVPDQITDPVYQKWSTMDEIYTGLELLQNLTLLNPDRTSLIDDYIGNNTKERFVQIVLAERSNETDLWWGNLERTVEAASILKELGVMSLSLAQLNEELNFKLQLADYYSSLAPQHITVNNKTIPGWTTLNLQDLLTYRSSRRFNEYN